jgi:hypothetical protein
MDFSRPAWPDPKRIHRALFGVYYEEDIFERLCQAAPWAMRALAWRLDERVRRRGLIFVHVPRAAGTSVAQALYGPRNTLHHSARYFRALDPAFFAAADSFAVLRDPVERFASAFAFVKAGGTCSCKMTDVFVRQTRAIRTVDDYLDFLEDRDPWSLDFVMRPQAWFVTDLRTGAVLVKRLFQLVPDMIELLAFLQRHGVASLPRLNASERLPLHLTDRQYDRIRCLYAQDFALIADLAAARADQAARLARVAAE